MIKEEKEFKTKEREEKNRERDQRRKNREKKRKTMEETEGESINNEEYLTKISDIGCTYEEFKVLFVCLFVGIHFPHKFMHG